MAHRGFKIDASLSADIVAYRVTLFDQAGNQAATKDFPDDASIAVAGEPTKRQFTLAGDPAFGGLDGTYTVETRAIDDAGNPSPPLGGALSLDFVPPTAPTNFEAF